MAFCGRSNCGKSSFINALTRNDVMISSNTPGRTQLANACSVQNDMLRLVDLPGYGYAKAGKDKAADWNAMIGRLMQAMGGQEWASSERVDHGARGAREAGNERKTASGPVQRLHNERTTGATRAVGSSNDPRPGPLGNSARELGAEPGRRQAANPGHESNQTPVRHRDPDRSLARDSTQPPEPGLAAPSPLTPFRVVLLIDARRGPMDLDLDFAGLLDHCHVPFYSWLTKADETRAEECEEKMRATIDAMRVFKTSWIPLVLPTSARVAGYPGMSAARCELFGFARACTTHAKKI